jgi:dynein heavy chain, axonemal
VFSLILTTVRLSLARAKRLAFFILPFPFPLFTALATDKVIKKKKEATEKSTEVEQNRKQITVEQEEAEEALRQALPDLENARSALDTLQRHDITEIRAFANPPEPVQIICECVSILKGFKDISWKTAKGMLADINFLKSLQEMNCDLITVKQVTSCRAHMKVCWFYDVESH